MSGVPLDRLDIESYRNQIATVFQDYGKYEFTVGENIALNNYDAETPSSAVDELLKKVGFPYDQHTRLGKQFGGDELSIGQWQRLAIARALYRKANLFIFDEFSSSLDPETEHRLFNDILALNTTVIAVTHRLGNIKRVRQDYRDVCWRGHRKWGLHCADKPSGKILRHVACAV